MYQRMELGTLRGLTGFCRGQYTAERLAGRLRELRELRGVQPERRHETDTDNASDDDFHVVIHQTAFTVGWPVVPEVLGVGDDLLTTPDTS